MNQRPRLALSSSLLALLLGAPSLAQSWPAVAPTPVPLEVAQLEESPLPTLSAETKNKLGRKIWANECGGRIMGLTSWNGGEEFPSLGIGHFIWYPKGFNGPFDEGFPKLVAFAQKRGIKPPAIALSADAPWSSKAAFEAAINSPEMKGLRTWLANSITLQTDFIIARSQAALPKMTAVAPAAQKARIKANYEKVASTPNGVYALIDYVNFKGEGISETERYKGKGWGLMWVLMDMKDVSSGQPAAREFAAAAKRVLDRRIANSPPDRGEERWRQGWHNRCDGYTQAI